MSKTVLIDVDGVLADFLGAILPIANAISGKKVTKNDIIEWDFLKQYPKQYHLGIQRRMNDLGFCYRLAALPGAKQAIEAFQSFGSDIEPVIVTAPMLSSQTWCYEREIWLRDILNFKGSIVHASAKQHVRGDFLIDDKYETLVKWLEYNPNGLAVLWSAPYNSDINIAPGQRIVRADSWDIIPEIFEDRLGLRLWKGV